MEKQKLIKEVTKCIEKTLNFKINTVTMNTTIKEAGIDSLHLFKFVSIIEDEFKVEIEDLDLTPENFKTISTVIELILDYKKQV